MGVTYKLKDEVVHFIISQRQDNPLCSCRQLAEAASEKFGLRLSKSSVHDVLRESGIVTPRGRKPKFTIPEEKKKQIQEGFAKIKLLAPIEPSVEGQQNEHKPLSIQHHFATSQEYKEAGKIFLKAALWDIGIYSQDNIKEIDWKYYLTYSKGIKIFLEKDQSVFIDLRLPIERCIREATDGLINNVRPMNVDKVSNEEVFKACMSRADGHSIHSIAIVDYKDDILFRFNNIVERKRLFNRSEIYFVESNVQSQAERCQFLFFPQTAINNRVIEEILNMPGFDVVGPDKMEVNLIPDPKFIEKEVLVKAASLLNKMYIYNKENKLVNVKII
ncbi:MAG: helix-turn-helix domain-containing protein [Candidatus Omnitrophica bacterium]|nr:helix-turn-helix domain-containing protein [Candidatus Omnitrophota bacterium]